jgi:hypothetical protein
MLSYQELNARKWRVLQEKDVITLSLWTARIAVVIELFAVFAQIRLQ